MTFAEKLRELREVAGLSEARLAVASGVSFGAVHNYGLGLRMPTFAAVVRLAKALGVDCTAFAECEDIQGEGPQSQLKKPSKKPEAPPAKKKPTRRPKK